MSGVGWEERREGYWLASNGRWYPSGEYPRGWSTTALPPAPGHRSERSLAASFTDAARQMTGSSDHGPPPSPPPASSGAAPRPGPSVYTSPVQSSSGPADATVTSQRTHASRLPTGPPPQRSLPSAPGRLAPPKPSPPQPGPPQGSPSPPAPTPKENVRPPMPRGVAGDVGRALGAARKRLEDAVESME